MSRYHAGLESVLHNAKESAPMNDSKKRHFAEQVKRFRARFVQKMGVVLGEVLPAPLLMQWVAEEAGHFRQRLYDPLQTLMLFVGCGSTIKPSQV